MNMQIHTVVHEYKMNNLKKMIAHLESELKKVNDSKILPHMNVCKNCYGRTNKACDECDRGSHFKIVTKGDQHELARKVLQRWERIKRKKTIHL